MWNASWFFTPPTVSTVLFSLLMNYSILFFFSEEPFSSVLLPEHYSTHCHQCFVCFFNELMNYSIFLFSAKSHSAACCYPSTTPPTATSAICALLRPCPAKSARSPDTAGLFLSSVADPWHICKDPDPDPRIRTAALRILIRIRILLFSWPSRFVCLVLFEGTFKSFFNEKKCQKSQ